MRLSRPLAIGLSGLAVSLTAGLAAAVGASAPAQAAPRISYVALGDSYSAGVGAGGNSGSCAQSPDAYPALWARAHPGASFTFAACSGATTADVLGGQLSALSPSTTLVSLTVGGNDVGFSSVMKTCVLGSTSTCESAVAAAERTAGRELPGRLDAVLSGIHAQAPAAQVVVLDYPGFYDTSAWFCPGLSGADHQALDAGDDELDGIIQAAAARHGDTFADVRARFAGHELCDNPAWLNSVTLPVEDSYHPTAAGQQDGYLPAFAAAVASVGQ